MTKRHLYLVVVATFTLAALTLWQKQREKSAREQLHLLIQRSEADAQELKRLYAMEVSFRQMEQENAQLKRERLSVTGQTPEVEEPKEEWVDLKYGPGTSDRGFNCQRWARALANYAREHKGQFPMRLREAAGYLGDDEIAFRTALTRDQFEILFQGHANDLGDPDKTPVITEKKPAQTGRGIWTRWYGYANWLARIQTSPDGTFSEIENPRKPSTKE